MKKLFASLACAALLITALTGCGQKTGSTRTPEELTQLYSQVITESGGEMVEYNPVITQIDDENEINGMILESMGLKAEDMTAFGVSGSMMSVKAYGIAAVMPAEGKEEAVKEGLQGFIDKQKTNFETYLADQYAVAENARLETLEDGTVPSVQETIPKKPYLKGLFLPWTLPVLTLKPLSLLCWRGRPQLW